MKRIYADLLVRGKKLHKVIMKNKEKAKNFLKNHAENNLLSSVLYFPFEIKLLLPASFY